MKKENKAITNYELIEQLNNAINTKHDVAPSKEYIDTISNKTYMYNILFNASKFYPKKKYNHVSDFISNEYINISKAICKALYKVQYVTKNGKTVRPNYESLKDIIHYNYDDCMFDDIAQEIALYMVEHSDSITCNNGVFDISDIMLDLMKVTRNYLYNNKLKIDKTHIAIIDYNDINNSDISIACNTRAYIDYCISCYSDMSLEQNIEYHDIIQTVINYIGFTEKPKISKACKQVLDCIVYGMKKKEISKYLNVSINTVTKYHNIIKSAYYECYKKPYNYKDNI